MIHPFAHLNSSHAAALLRSEVQSRSVSSNGFVRALRDVEPRRESVRAGSQRTIAPEQDLSEEEPIAPPAPDAPPPFFPGPTDSSVPRFLDVPDAAKWPLGPYKQAPVEFGGEWWLVNPFTGEQPWLNQGVLEPVDPGAEPPPDPDADLPADFVAVFGTRPSRADQGGVALADWERNLEHFQGSGVPEGYTQEEIDRAAATFESWGMGRPVFYEGRYGWRAAFPDTGMGVYEADVFATLTASHLVVARYQADLANAGDQPLEQHPFTPPQVFSLPNPDELV